MNIAIVGAPDSVKKIYDILAPEYTEINFLQFSESKIEKMIPLVKNIKEEISGFFFTGSGVYAFLNLNSDITKKPCVYTKRSEGGIIKALWNLRNDYNNFKDLSVGIDLVEEKILKNLLKEYEINLEYTLQPYDDLKSEEEYLNFYLKKLEAKEINCVITAFGHIYFYLKNKNIPVYRLQATNSEIKEEFKKLQFLIKINQLKKNNFGAEIIKLKNFYFKNIEDKNYLTSQLLDYTKKVQGNLQLLENNVFFILTNNFFLLENENINFFKNLSNEFEKKGYLLKIGLGEGDTILQAINNSKKALTLSLNKNNIYFCNSQKTIGPLSTENTLYYEDSSDKYDMELAKKTGISHSYLNKIKYIISKYNKTNFSSKELSEILEITERSVNRILKPLLENGYAEEIEYKTTSRVGRPRRIIKFNF